MKTNARKELEQFLNQVTQHSPLRTILCASIYYDPDGIVVEEEQRYMLVMGYTDKQYKEWIESLDFEYDAGHGWKLLYGNIWFSDNTWAERGEYDGKEWWDLNQVPRIPDALRMPVEKTIATQMEAARVFVERLGLEDPEQMKKDQDKFAQEFSEMLKRLSPRPEEDKETY